MQRVLCETVKDFVAKVGKTYEKAMENADEADSMTLKVRMKFFVTFFPNYLLGFCKCFKSYSSEGSHVLLPK